MADTSGAANAYLLDLSRLISRAGRVPTGVDRVERAYLDHLLTLDAPLFGLVRTAYGFALLDRAGMQALRDRFAGRAGWGRADMLSRLRRGLPQARKQAEADVRRLAIARCLPARLGAMLRRHLPRAGVYMNVGHANLTDRVLAAVRHGAGARIAVMIHDTIPLDHPHYQRPEVVARFAPMLRRVRARADWIICNSGDTADDVRRHMSEWGPVPDRIIAHLGVDVPVPAHDWPYPAGFDPSRPWFVTIGTIEPRKNHGLLLDVWAALARDGAKPMPQLVICGSRGWMNDAVFARLDGDAAMGRDVFEVPGLSDAQIAAVLTGSLGLLFPSLAEGFGLPPAEAAALGVPVICNDLPVYHEILGDIPVYAKGDGIYPWIKGIEAALAANNTGRHVVEGVVPDWGDHFNTVLSKLT